MSRYLKSYISQNKCTKYISGGGTIGGYLHAEEIKTKELAEAWIRSLLEQYKPGRRLHTNVEYFATAVMRAVSLPTSLFTPTFTAGRIVGWTAHVLEQAENNRIFRPQSTYVGPLPE